jgi:LDH2 family malate/lactate/ureidoglycolate dehydrogenase
MGENRRRYPAAAVRDWLAAVLASYGMPAFDAALGAEVLLDADLTGIETHGLANLGGHPHYAPGLESGAVRADLAVEVLRESPVTAAWDAGRGFGPVVAHRAMATAIAKADEHGVGMVTVRDGCHLGAAGYFARMAAERGLIGMVMSHTAPSAIPPGGAAPGVGTNPLAVGAPVRGRAPFVFDMAVTAVAGTRVQVAQREGRRVPPGWIVDGEGRPTTDPTDYAGLLLLGAGPAGGGHKGFGLGLVVDILSGLLSGTGSGLFQRFGPQWRIGYWLAAVRVDAFVDPEEFDLEMLRLVDALHALPPAPGSAGVLFPGERGSASRADRAARGIPLDGAVVRACAELGERRGHAFPQALAPAG